MISFQVNWVHIRNYLVIEFMHILHECMLVYFSRSICCIFMWSLATQYHIAWLSFNVCSYESWLFEPKENLQRCSVVGTPFGGPSRWCESWPCRPKWYKVDSYMVSLGQLTISLFLYLVCIYISCGWLNSGRAFKNNIYFSISLVHGLR